MKTCWRAFGKSSETADSGNDRQMVISMPEEKVFELLADVDALDYEGLHAEGSSMILDTVPRRRTTREWKVHRVSKSWNIPSVRGVPGNNDYPCVDLVIPAFSKRAVESLRGFLETNGELLPLKVRQGNFFAYNLTTVADILDEEKSFLKLARDGVTATRIDKWVFKKNDISSRVPSVFRIPQRPLDILVTKEFVDRVTSNGLRGFVFRIVS